ncbi:phosphatase PAP2 family protein [Hufsiella ginkgonis]|uniref:Phosphatase PAP2 family protein n=1 Tax=Hufsiella ginkgonis TaxID=2695274 RepID=A0A7K1XWR1_9SPHI|nr:phosphatase PAP2 family protein [Hufsiella ginkgonis]MXV15443.1 phosphatase PAP2 family protein [Hufsiella ginkgonis]
MLRSTKKVIHKVIAEVALLAAETLAGLALFLVSSILFFVIAGYVFLAHRSSFDNRVFSYLSGFVSDSNSRLMLFFSILGNAAFLVTANLLLILYFLFIRKRRWYSVRIVSVALSSVLMMLILKEWFARPRPPMPLLDPAIGLSFPSGHAMSSVTFYGLIIFFTWRNRRIKPGYRVAIAALLVAVVFMIGLSRVYLKVHYASDVLGGYCAGAIWLCLSLYVIRKIEEYSRKKLQPVVEN